jgi:hypothetical protein
MLINLYGKNKRGILNYDFPAITLDQRFNYKIGITSINFELRDHSDIRDNELFCLVTNLVDLSVNNTFQSIVNLAYVHKRRIQNKQIDFARYHSLNLYELQNATFDLQRLQTEKICELNHIFIQLDIQRVDAYGRIQ